MIPKHTPVRSKKLRHSARGMHCTVRLPGCTGGGEDTVLAHLPGCGRGVGTKTSDINAVFACHVCHDIIDGRRRLPIIDSNKDVYYHALIRAHAETLQYWYESGLVQVK